MSENYPTDVVKIELSEASYLFKYKKGYCEWCEDSNEKTIYHWQGQLLDYWVGKCCIQLVEWCEQSIDHDKS